MIQFLINAFLFYVSIAFLIFLVYTYFEFQNTFPLFTFFIFPKMKEEYKEIIRQMNRDYDLQKKSIILCWPIYLTLFAFFGIVMR
ncbi:hypothetical protein [Nostoc phage A1]|nr:hypothetical protein [Nostoc phage A1]